MQDKNFLPKEPNPKNNRPLSDCILEAHKHFGSYCAWVLFLFFILAKLMAREILDALSSLNFLELHEKVIHSMVLPNSHERPFRRTWSSHIKWKGFRNDAQLSVVIVFNEPKYTFLSVTQHYVLEC